MTLANMTAGNYTVTWGGVAGWTTPSPVSITQTLAANGSLVFLGTYTVATGSVTIDAEPNDISAPWELVGPGGYSHVGTGDATIADLTAGDYTLSWGSLTSWTTPIPQEVSQTLAASGSLTFTGTYLARTGAVVVDVAPGSLGAPWQLSGPYGYVLDGAGDSLLDDLIIGSYTITWGNIDGFTAPGPETSELTEGATLAFLGDYSEIGLSLPFPDTADKLMQNFQTIYEYMDIVEFRKLIHPDHITILQASTYNQFPDVGTTLDVNEELRIHERMSSMSDQTDPLGALVPGVQSISFQTFARNGTWGQSPPTDQIPNAEVALYEVVFLFDRGGLHSTLKVQGAIKFYVTHRDSSVSGVIRPYYQMLGQMDLTQDSPSLGAGGKRDEVTSWGGVKVLFR